MVGLAGGVLGLLLSFGGLWLIRCSPKRWRVVAQHGLGDARARPSRWRVVASILAGLLPTWRACQVTPALQLKSQ